MDSCKRLCKAWFHAAWLPVTTVLVTTASVVAYGGDVTEWTFKTLL